MRTLALPILLAVAGVAALPANAVTAVEAPTRTIKVGDDTVAYRTLGSGRPLLMVNRFRGTVDTWDPAFLDPLARRHTLYLFDLPGIGYSQGVQPDSMERGVELLDGIATALGLEAFDLLGWSWGGLLSQAYVIDHPGRVRRLVLLATIRRATTTFPCSPRSWSAR
jgi:pimeloyl-ACP methyl ester carboxylesterase